MSTNKGFFADAAASDLPPDDASKGPHLDVSDTPPADSGAKAEAERAAAADAEKAAKEKADSQKVATEAKAAEEAAKEKAKSEAEAKSDLVNPHVASEKPTTQETEEDDDKKPAGMTDKAYVSWKAIKTEKKAALKERDDARTEVAALKKQLEEAAKTGPEMESVRKELADTKQRLAEYENEISIARVESTRQFKDQVSGPLSALTTDMTELAKRYEIPADTLMRAIQEPDASKRAAALGDIISDFNTVDQHEVVQAAKDYQRIQRVAGEMRQDAGKKLEELNRQTKAEAEQAAAMTTQDYRTGVHREWDLAQQAIPEIRKAEGHDEWNKHLDAIRQQIESISVNELPVEDVAKFAIAYHILPEIRSVAKHYETVAAKKSEEVAAANERASAAEKKLVDYMKTAPGAGGGNGSSSSASSKKSSLFADAVLEAT